MKKKQDKKKILAFLATSRKIKSREIIYLLQYIINQDDLIDNITFVENAKKAPRGVVITDRALDGPQLTYYRGEAISNSAEVLFHDMRLNSKEEWFFEIDFQGIYSSSLYLSILEDISFSNDSPKLTKKEKNDIERLLEHTMELGREYRLKEAINQALDSKDKKLFLELTEELDKIEEEQSF